LHETVSGIFYTDAELKKGIRLRKNS